MVRLIQTNLFAKRSLVELFRPPPNSNLRSPQMNLLSWQWLCGTAVDQIPLIPIYRNGINMNLRKILYYFSHYECENCKHVFADKDALYENSVKNFICPKCKHYLEVLRIPDLPLENFTTYFSIIGLCIILILVFFKIYIPNTIKPYLIIFGFFWLISTCYFSFCSKRKSRLKGLVEKTVSHGRSSL